MGIGVKSKEDRLDLVTQLQGKGYQVFDMTENEAAKVHVRHMVGGHRRSPSAEMLFRFEFPERPGCFAAVFVGSGVRLEYFAIPLSKPRLCLGPGVGWF